MLSKGDYYIAKGKQIKARKRERGEKEERKRERGEKKKEKRKGGFPALTHIFVVFHVCIKRISDQ